MWKIQIIEKNEKLKGCDSLDVHDGLGNFQQTKAVNLGPRATNANESLVERVLPDQPRSLRPHFYAP